MLVFDTFGTPSLEDAPDLISHKRLSSRLLLFPLVFVRGPPISLCSSSSYFCPYSSQPSCLLHQSRNLIATVVMLESRDDHYDYKEDPAVVVLLQDMLGLLSIMSRVCVLLEKRCLRVGRCAGFLAAF